MVGGQLNGGTGDKNTFQIYDIAADSWTLGPNITVARGYIMCEYSNYDGNHPAIYAIGGYTVETVTRHDMIEKYSFDNPSVGWQLLNTSLSVARLAGDLILYDKYIFVIAGYSNSGRVSTCDILNVALDQMVENVNNLAFPIAESGLDFISFDGLRKGDQFYSVGGQNAAYTLRTLSISNQSTTTLAPSSLPSILPSNQPSNLPSNIPTRVPSKLPTNLPTAVPTAVPSKVPSNLPSNMPTDMPTSKPTAVPSNVPSNLPSNMPSIVPTNKPTSVPSQEPTRMPSNVPTNVPTGLPTSVPTVASIEPSMLPTNIPTNDFVANTNTSNDATGFVSTSLPTKVPSLVEEEETSKTDSNNNLVNDETFWQIIALICIGLLVLIIVITLMFVCNKRKRQSNSKTSDNALKSNEMAFKLQKSVSGSLELNSPIAAAAVAARNAEESKESEDAQNELLYGAGPPTKDATANANQIDENVDQSEGATNNGMTGRETTDNIESDWENWNEMQVMDWLSKQLAFNGMKEETIDTFMNEFETHHITGKILIDFKNSQQLLEEFKNEFNQKSFGIWRVVKVSIKELKSNV